MVFRALSCYYRRPKLRRLLRQLRCLSSAGCVPFDLQHLGDFLRAPTNFADSRRAAGAAHALLVKLHDSVGFSFSLWNKLLALYARRGLRDAEARQLFDRMPLRDTASYNTMISAHAAHGKFQPSDVLRLYSQMLKEGIKPDKITLSTLLTISYELVEQIHAHSIQLGINSDAFVGGAMVNGYARQKGLDEAVRVFEEIDELDLVSWNIMIDACARRGSKRHSVDIFLRMRREGPGRFDCFALTSVLKTCSEREDFSLGMQLHGCSWRAGLMSETATGNALITMYFKCGGERDSATKVFHGISEPNIISWTSVISGLVQKDHGEEAVGIYKEMLCSGETENEFCLSSVATAFGILARLEYGRMIHSRIIKMDFCSDLMVRNALVGMYFKCGSPEDAKSVFETMQARDMVSWTILILGLGQHGKGREALEMFRALERREIKPDSTAFIAVLSACSHAGLIEEGLEIFRSMVNDYGIVPKREHCACIVDMLGRSGRLGEAESFIRQMGIGSDSLLAWETLLGACGIHGEIGLGEISAEKVLELEPHKHGAYVLLSNMYAERRLWERKENLRGRLDTSGLIKETAYSL